MSLRKVYVTVALHESCLHMSQEVNLVLLQHKMRLNLAPYFISTVSVNSSPCLVSV